MNTPRERSPLRAVGVALLVVALVGCTIVTLLGIGLVMSMRNVGSNK